MGCQGAGDRARILAAGDPGGSRGDGQELQMTIDEFEKFEFIFVWCFVFGETYQMPYQALIPLNTKHQILNTLANSPSVG